MTTLPAGPSEIPSTHDKTLFLRNNETSDTDVLFTQSFTPTIEQGGGQLGSAQTKTVHLSIPRDIISSSISSTILNADIVRPIVAGTYHNEPAYLVRLQIQLEAPGRDQSLISRIQNAKINALLEDAPVRNKVESSGDLHWDWKRRPTRAESEPEHPSFVKTFPGSEGWIGPVSVPEVSTNKEVGLQAGWNGLGANASDGQSRATEALGALKITAERKGSQRNSLVVSIAEGPVRMTGVPSYLTIPVILTHHSRPFSMHVSLNTKLGFWQGGLAEIVPVLGRADKPLFFDPKVLQQMMETEEREIGGVRVVEWGDKLEDVDLKMYSSLISDSQ